MVTDMINLIAEKILQKAIEEDRFDISSKRGTPLNLEENPFQDPSSRLSFYIFKNAGMKPPWLETEVEIRNMLKEAREELVRAVEAWDQESRNWKAAENEFYRRVEEANMLIRDLNLKTPLTRFQRTLITPKKELEEFLASLHID
jgi:phosphoglycolate phosphatase-like HAD superfamily hydrolase